MIGRKKNCFHQCKHGWHLAVSIFVVKTKKFSPQRKVNIVRIVSFVSDFFYCCFFFFRRIIFIIMSENGTRYVWSDVRGVEKWMCFFGCWCWVCAHWASVVRVDGVHVWPWQQLKWNVFYVQYLHVGCRYLADTFCTHVSCGISGYSWLMLSLLLLTNQHAKYVRSERKK